MSSAPAGDAAPHVSKPDVFEALERICANPDTVQAIHRDLHAKGAHGAAEMAELALRYGVCDDATAQHMRRDWGEGGWFGPVMDEVNQKFRRASALLLDPGAKGLSAWWVQGGTDRVFIEVHRLGDVVRLVLHSPFVPGEIFRAKAHAPRS